MKNSFKKNISYLNGKKVYDQNVFYRTQIYFD